MKLGDADAKAEGVAVPAQPVLADLVEPEYNPRTIDQESLQGLGVSLDRFGDISGLVWNSRSRRLVCGAQRMKVLRLRYGEALAVQDGAVVTPDGGRFPIRVVDWDDVTEKAANIAANSDELMGEFTAALAGLADEIEAEAPDLWDGLRMKELVDGVPDESQGNAPGDAGIPDSFVQGVLNVRTEPYEHHDCVLIVCRRPDEWFRLCDLLKMERVPYDDRVKAGAKRHIGWLRAVRAENLLARFAAPVPLANTGDSGDAA